MIRMTAVAIAAALFAAPAFADGMSSTNSMAPTHRATANAMAPASGGMMAPVKPKPSDKKKHGGGAIASANTMAPANAMAPSNTTGGSSH